MAITSRMPASRTAATDAAADSRGGSRTAAAIAGEVSWDSSSLRTGTEVREHGLPEDPTSLSVLARVDPDQKYDLVALLQDRGHVVAMTGDGVNDAPALRRADIGVALGRTGSDVAREAADIVVTDDDLATIVAAIHEGRTIHDNLRKVIDYLVASNLSEILVVVTSLVAVPALGIPLYPLQLLRINLLTDGLPALALGVDPAHPAVMERLHEIPANDCSTSDTSAGWSDVGRSWPWGRWARSSWPIMRSTSHRRLNGRCCSPAWSWRSWPTRGWSADPRTRRVHSGRTRGCFGALSAALALQVVIVTVPVLASLFDTVALPLAAWFGAIAGGAVGPGLLLAWDRVVPKR